MKWFFLLLGLTVQLCANPFDDVSPSTADEIASLNENLIVDGFVSAMSGQLSLSEVDLHVRGAQDLIFKRTYIPPQVLGRYHDKDEKDRLALGSALLQLNTKGWVVLPHLWAGYNRNSPYFQVRDPQGYVLEFEVQGNQGILKSSSYGCSNLRSGEPSSSADIRNIEFLVEDGQVRVTWPEGTQRIFIYQRAGFYRLDTELLPNGKAIRYQWNHEGLSRIVATDPSGKYTYAYLDRIGEDHYRGSDGREVQLAYESREIKGKNKKLKAEFRFPVMTRATNPVYSNSVGYNDRTLLTSYDAKAYSISCNYFQQKGVPSRIQNFSTPSGSTSFSYDSPIAGEKGGSTTVNYPSGSVTIYRFNSSLLLTHLENWFENRLYNQKVFSYDHKQHVAKIETKDAQGNTLLEKVYQCDASGNPTLETHIGDFGTFTIKRTFSKNRLTSEVRNDGLGLEYTYLGDTHLPLSKTTLTNDQPVRRTLYSYDDANNLIEKKEEGQTITSYYLYQKGPHLHRVQMEEKKDWEGNLIRQIKYTYDQFGNAVKEDHYGSDGKHAYSIQRTYDEKGNLLEETNPLGQTATYTYDARSRPIKEIPFSNRLTIDRTFDDKGRLTLLKEEDHVTSFAYNVSDELIEKTDYLGLTTNYTYHPVHGKPTLIEAEPTRLEITYDAFGREIEKKDVYGASTRTLSNSYGDPLEIIHPDGGRETFAYASNGLLLEKIDPDGLQTSYSYDPLGRVVSKKIGDYETTYAYDAYHLVEEKDPLGASTFYSYNLAGQKIKEKRAGRVTCFTYDPLGYLASETRSRREIFFQNDVLGRVIEKDVDGVLKTTYTYDCAGNIDSISKGDPIYFSYDPYDRLVEKIDADGHKTVISYEEGNQLLTKRVRDPRGVEAIETYSAHGLLLKKEIPAASLEEFKYDKALRLISQDHLTFTYTPEGYLSSMCEGGTRTTYWTYTLGGKIQSKCKPDGTTLQYEYNSQGELTRVGMREFVYDATGRLTEGSGFQRTLDPFGNILREEFTNGLAIESSYDDWNRPTERILPDQSKILYEYEGPFLRTVTRVNRDEATLYSHSYEEFDDKGNPLTETGLFTASYSYDKSGRRTFQKNPYFEEILRYDPAGNLIQKGKTCYSYDDASQLTSEEDRFIAEYDQHYNCIHKNGEEIEIDDLNQRRDAEYDRNGNLLRLGFVYDEFDQLVQTPDEQYSYDAIGRRLTSGAASYFYINDEEIGSFENGQIRELKVLGSIAPIAIEVASKPFAPVVDAQNTIRQLIDWKTGEVVLQNSCDVFGNSLTGEIPYAYVGKRYDTSTGLIYFGKRFYDPNIGRWLTPDPLGAVDHSNLYQYVFNNPYLFRDPNGENVLGFLCGIGQIVAGGAIMASGVALEIATFGGYTFAFGFHEAAGFGLMASGCAMATYHAQDIKIPSISWKNTDVYAPDRPLPLDGYGVPIPEADVPHTEIGTKDGRKGKYPQAREFDGYGKPVRDIDFTDHGRPQNHPNPHQHEHKPNPTGGTQIRDPKGQPVTGWNY